MNEQTCEVACGLAHVFQWLLLTVIRKLYKLIFNVWNLMLRDELFLHFTFFTLLLENLICKKKHPARFYYWKL